MRSDDLIAEMQRIWQECGPSHWVAPENRGVAVLTVTPTITRGAIFRLTPDPQFWPDPADRAPRILIHPADVAVLREYFSGPGMPISDQALADLAEQLFAEQEARGGRG